MKRTWMFPSGREAYEKNHIQGAVFADLYKDFSETGSEFSFTHPSREKFINIYF